MYALSHPHSGSKRSHYRLQDGHILRKNVPLKLDFQKEGQLYANWLFYIFTIYYKCPLFQFFSHGICMHLPILTGIQKRRINDSKMVTFYKKLHL